MALKAQPSVSLLSSPAVFQAVRRINKAIQRGVAADTVRELLCPEAQLPPVYPSAAAVYQQELALLQRQQQGVSLGSMGSPCGVLGHERHHGRLPRAPCEDNQRCRQGYRTEERACLEESLPLSTYCLTDSGLKKSHKGEEDCSCVKYGGTKRG